jgi:hypothetical protein
MGRIRSLSSRAGTLFRSVATLTTREKQYLIAEMSQIKGLMPLLMKPRNQQRWTAEDKAQMALHLRRLSHISPYLVVLVMPGGFFLLPALVWWLDRRRNRARARAGGA